MDFKEWQKYYLEIVNQFGFDIGQDIEAAMLLIDLVKGKDIVPVDKVEGLIAGKDVYVFGGAGTLNEHLKRYEFPGTLISADGATTALVKKGLMPDLIVTDLDGRMEDQVAMNKKGAIVLPHAHGDNMPALRKWVPKITGPILPTCQVAPPPPLVNFGGFTDGDRAVFLADHFKAKNIYLVGFDFEGKDSAFKTMDKVKLKKLDWAHVLIAMLDNPAIQFIEDRGGPRKAKADDEGCEDR
jgi:uncharacterized Rossmann fold enzyme